MYRGTMFQITVCCLGMHAAWFRSRFIRGCSCTRSRCGRLSIRVLPTGSGTGVHRHRQPDRNLEHARQGPVSERIERIASPPARSVAVCVRREEPALSHILLRLPSVFGPSGRIFPSFITTPIVNRIHGAGLELGNKDSSKSHEPRYSREATPSHAWALTSSPGPVSPRFQRKSWPPVST